MQSCVAPSCRGRRPSSTANADPRPRPAAPGLVLCRSCRDRLAADLVALPGLYAELERNLATSRGMLERVRGSGTPGIRLNQQAVNVRADMLAVLASWADLVVDGSGATPPARTVPALAAFLGRKLRWLSARPAAGDAADEIATLAQAAKTAARPDPSRRIQLGPCVVDGCNGRLTALVRDRDAALPSAITCDTGTDHAWPPDLWHTLQGRRAVATRVGLTADDIARIWRIARGTVYWMASVHRLRRRRRGRRVYYASEDVITTLESEGLAGPAPAPG